MLGGMQDLQVLPDGGGFGRAVQQLVVGHSEPRGGIHVVHVPVVDKRSRLPDQRVDHVAEVDRFLALTELTRHVLDALIPVPEFEVILVNTHFQLQADVFAADRIRIPLDANDAVGLDRHRHGSASRSSLGRQRIQDGRFFTKPLLAGRVKPHRQLAQESRVVVDAAEVTALAQPQRLVQCVLEVAVRRLDVSVLVRLADIDPMALEAVVFEQVTIGSGEFSIVREVVHRRR